jgi:hypothetical protein
MPRVLIQAGLKASAMKDVMHQLQNRHPDACAYFELAMRENPNLHTICEEYRACRNAFLHWSQSKEPEAVERARDYHTLIGELEHEILEILNRYSRR